MRMFFVLALLSFFNQNQASAGSDSPTPQTLIIECPVEIYLVEGQAFDTSITGAPKVLSNNGGAIILTWIEYYSPGNCANSHDVITRIFTIRNSLGDLERCSQRIYLKHLNPSSISVPFDTTVSYPRDISFSAAILQAHLPFRMITFTYTDTKVSNGCNVPVRIRREWKFTDLCSGVVTQKISFINVLNYQNSFEHNRIVEDAICEQEGYIEIIPKGEFGPYKYRWNTNDSVNILTNLLPGIYSAVVTDKFGCNQLQNVGLQSMSDKADVGGRIVTQNDYRVYPDSIYFGVPSNVDKVCLSPNGGLHYGMTLHKKNSGFMEYRLVKRTEATEGISSRDIIFIQRHILAIEKFVDTLKNFAADVNNNKNVTASDITELRRIILGVKNNFTEVLPWYFLVQNWRQVMTPFQSFQSIQFTGIQIVNFPRTNADILAMKMGDIDLSYRRQLIDDKLTARAKGTDVHLLVKNQKINTGEIIEVPFYLRSSKGLLGIQSSINACGGAEILDITNVQLDQESIHWDEHGIHVSHTDGFPIKWNPEQPLFILKIKANQYNSMLSNLICLEGRLEPEYYLEDVSEHGLDLIFEDQINDSPIFNVLPNPAQEYCWLTSNVSNLVKYEIVNIHGQSIQTGKFNGSFLLETRAWTEGIYFIRFYQADQMLDSKRLVILK